MCQLHLNLENYPIILYVRMFIGGFKNKKNLETETVLSFNTEQA